MRNCCARQRDLRRIPDVFGPLPPETRYRRQACDKRHNCQRLASQVDYSVSSTGGDVAGNCLARVVGCLQSSVYAHFKLARHNMISLAHLSKLTAVVVAMFSLMGMPANAHAQWRWWSANYWGPSYGYTTYYTPVYYTPATSCCYAPTCTSCAPACATCAPCNPCATACNTCAPACSTCAPVVNSCATCTASKTLVRMPTAQQQLANVMRHSPRLESYVMRGKVEPIAVSSKSGLKGTSANREAAAKTVDVRSLLSDKTSTPSIRTESSRNVSNTKSVARSRQMRVIESSADSSTAWR